MRYTELTIASIAHHCGRLSLYSYHYCNSFMHMTRHSDSCCVFMRYNKYDKSGGQG